MLLRDAHKWKGGWQGERRVLKIISMGFKGIRILGVIKAVIITVAACFIVNNHCLCFNILDSGQNQF